MPTGRLQQLTLDLNLVRPRYCVPPHGDRGDEVAQFVSRTANDRLVRQGSDQIFDMGAVERGQVVRKIEVPLDL